MEQKSQLLKHRLYLMLILNATNKNIFGKECDGCLTAMEALSLDSSSLSEEMCGGVVATLWPLLLSWTAPGACIWCCKGHTNQPLKVLQLTCMKRTNEGSQKEWSVRLGKHQMKVLPTKCYQHWTLAPTSLYLYGRGRSGKGGWYHYLWHYRWHDHGAEEHAVAALLYSIHLLVEQRNHFLHHLDPPAQCLYLCILHLTFKAAVEVIVLHPRPLATVPRFLLRGWRIPQITVPTASLSITAAAPHPSPILSPSYWSSGGHSGSLAVNAVSVAGSLGTVWLASTWHIHRLTRHSRVRTSSSNYLV